MQNKIRISATKIMFHKIPSLTKEEKRKNAPNYKKIAESIIVSDSFKYIKNVTRAF